MITSDLKEDWWLEKRGKKLGPRKELLNEIHTKSPDLKAFHMFDTSNFLRRVDENFTVNVSESTISETESLLATDRNKSELDEWVVFQDFFELVISNVEGLSVIRSESLTDLPPLKTPIFSLHNTLSEVVNNVVHHARKRSLFIDARIDRNHRTIRFSNSYFDSKPISKFSYGDARDDNRNERGVGLDMIKKKTLLSEGVHVQISYEQTIFVLEIFIPLSKFV